MRFSENGVESFKTSSVISGARKDLIFLAGETLFSEAAHLVSMPAHVISSPQIF